MTSAVSQPVYPGSTGHGAAYKEVLVQAVDYGASKAVVLDQLGKTMQVRCDIMRAKGNVPAVGERWLVDRQYGNWTFAAIMNGGNDGVIIPTASVTNLDTTLSNHVGLINNVDNSAQARDTAQIAATTGQIAAKGDILGGTAAGVVSRLPAGTQNLQTLVPDSTAPTGLAWKTPLALPVALTGATAPGRYVGQTSTAGAPTTGTFLVGDWIRDSNGLSWVCNVAGSPGTWASGANSRLTAVESSSSTNATNIAANASTLSSHTTSIASNTTAIANVQASGKHIWTASGLALSGGGGDLVLTTWSTYFSDGIATLGGSGLFQFNRAGKWALHLYCGSDCTVTGSMLWYIAAGNPNPFGAANNTLLRTRAPRASGFSNAGRLDQSISWVGRVAPGDASQAFAVHVSWQASDGATNATINYAIDLEYLGAA